MQPYPFELKCYSTLSGDHNVLIQIKKCIVLAAVFFEGYKLRVIKNDKAESTPKKLQ